MMERKWISREEAEKIWPSQGSEFKKENPPIKKNQTCRFCEDPNSILTKETCCTGCSMLKD